MSSIIVAGDTSGSITLQAPAVSGSTVLTLPAVSGTVLTSTSPQSSFPPNIAGNGPAFSAYLSASAQSITGSTFTKIQMSGELFDTANCFDSTTNYRFTPTTAGYYQINLSVYCDYTVTAFGRGTSAIYKNGSVINDTTMVSTFYGALNCNVLIQMNGTTDYLEFYGAIYSGAGLQFLGVSGTNKTYVTGYLARSA